MAQPVTYTPKQDISVDYNGAPVMLHAGVTTVREGHQLLKGREDLFEVVSGKVDYEVGGRVRRDKTGA